MNYLFIIPLLINGFVVFGQGNTACMRGTTEKTFCVGETKPGWEPINGNNEYTTIKTFFSTHGLPLQKEIYQNGRLKERLTYYYQQKQLVAIQHNSGENDSTVSSDLVQGYFHEIYPLKTNLYDGKNTLVNYRIHTYDSQNRRTKTIVYTPGNEIVAETNFQYNSKNATTRTTRASKTFVYVDYKYLSYDGNGNWTQRLEITNSKETLLNIRTIEYY